MYLSHNASQARLTEAENARRNRHALTAALSHGQVSRRELIKLGLFTAAGTSILNNRPSPFAHSAFAHSNIPTGLPPSPLFGVTPFTQPMLRFDVLPRNPVSSLNPGPWPSRLEAESATASRGPLTRAPQGRRERGSSTEYR